MEGALQAMFNAAAAAATRSSSSSGGSHSVHSSSSSEEDTNRFTLFDLDDDNEVVGGVGFSGNNGDGSSPPCVANFISYIDGMEDNEEETQRASYERSQSLEEELTKPPKEDEKDENQRVLDEKPAFIRAVRGRADRHRRPSIQGKPPTAPKRSVVSSLASAFVVERKFSFNFGGSNDGGRRTVLRRSQSSREVGSAGRGHRGGGFLSRHDLRDIREEDGGRVCGRVSAVDGLDQFSGRARAGLKSLGGGLRRTLTVGSLAVASAWGRSSASFRQKIRERAQSSKNVSAAEASEGPWKRSQSQFFVRRCTRIF